MDRKTQQIEPLLLGCHLSIAGGLASAVDAAEALGNRVLQIFSHNPMAWRMAALSAERVRAYRVRVAASALRVVAIHAMYLLNLASPDGALYERSVAALTEEIDRADRLNADYLVIHLGAHKGSGHRAGTTRVAEALIRVSEQPAFCNAERLHLLLENASGAGTSVGTTFEEIGTILSALPDAGRVGVCLDTCHAFAAGYDLRTVSAVDATVDALDRAIGLDRLKLIHLNDSKFVLGSHRDRHAHLGSGEIGREGLDAIVNHVALVRCPLVLETPKNLDGQGDADPINLRFVKALRTGGEPA